MAKEINRKYLPTSRETARSPSQTTNHDLSSMSIKSKVKNEKLASSIIKLEGQNKLKLQNVEVDIEEELAKDAEAKIIEEARIKQEAIAKAKEVEEVIRAEMEKPEEDFTTPRKNN